MSRRHTLPQELRELVSRSVAVLGEVIRLEAGVATYRRIEGIRSAMTGLRGRPLAQVSDRLRLVLRGLERLPAERRREVARAFGMMLELINRCESAYRTYRIRREEQAREPGGPEAILYVLTAHPTEARAPENVRIFREVQDHLIHALEQGFEA